MAFHSLSMNKKLQKFNPFLPEGVDPKNPFFMRVNKMNSTRIIARAPTCSLNLISDSF